MEQAVLGTLSITKVVPTVIDEWTGVSIHFKVETADPSNVCAELETNKVLRSELFLRILGSQEVKEYGRRAKGKTVSAGRDGSYPEIKVDKPMFIPRSVADIDDWQFWVDGATVVAGSISGSTR